MNKKNLIDLIVCSISAAAAVLCFTYIEHGRERDVLSAFFGIACLVFLILAVLDRSEEHTSELQSQR